MRHNIFLSKKGFTLIELMIVVMIIGIIAAIGVPAYLGQQKKAARTEAFSNLQSLRLLEEQFFAENGRYTVNLGTAAKDNPGNVNVIQIGGGDSTNALPGFRPGVDLSFSYWILQNFSITNAAANPPTTAASAAGTSCFVAFATGNTGSRVNNDVFAIDCNNNKNF